MIYIKWFVLALANLLMLVLAYALAPFLPLEAIGMAHLPGDLAWFDTPDNPLDGDASFQSLHAPFPGAQTGWRQYVNRVFWLWRNPAYGFDLSVLGLTPNGTPIVTGPLPIGGALVQGWYFARCANGFQFYRVWLWGSHASRINVGWKLWQVPGRCQFALSINPFITT